VCRYHAGSKHAQSCPTLASARRAAHWDRRHYAQPLSSIPESGAQYTIQIPAEILWIFEPDAQPKIRSAIEERSLE
jgi:hypothetical protein